MVIIGYLYVILCKLLNQAEGMLTRRYSKKHGDGGMFFNAVVCLFSMVFFVLTDKNGLCFTKDILIYGLISAVMFALGFYSLYRALQLGSYMLTIMISSFSGVVFLLYALIHLKEDASFFRYIAIILSFASVTVINLGKKDKTKTAFSLKWLIWSLVCLLSNGFISIINREQQLLFDAKLDNEFMILSLGGSFVLLMILGMCLERKQFRSVI